MKANYAVEVVVSGVSFPLYYEVSGDLGVDIGWAVKIELAKRETSGWVTAKLSLDEAIEQLKIEVATKKSLSPKKAAPQQQLGLFSTFTSPAHSPQTKVKLKSVLSGYPAFSPKQLDLYSWMADYYGYPLAEVIDNAVPKFQTSRPEKLAEATTLARTNSTDPSWLAAIEKKSKVKAAILKRLLSASGAISIKELAPLASSFRQALTSLQNENLVTISERINVEDIIQKSNQADHFFAAPETLTSQQTTALENITKAITAREFHPTLLHGVTGSGKTEVYIRAVEHARAQGLTTLIVVPEISLTPQLLDRFTSRLKEPIAVLHSEVGASVRWLSWDATLQGNVSIAIGARSAIFAPLSNLGLIIVDEEHDQSYKQGDGLRYHGRDVAIMRAKFEHCPVILGSATPSFETLYRAYKRKYTLLELPDRATTRPLPEVEIVNLGEIKRSAMPSENISPQLFEALNTVLQKKEQAIILYNRRGFSSFLQCSTCNQVVMCPQCSVSFTYHKRTHKLVCHYCNYTINAPQYCSHCRDPRLTAIEVDKEGTPLRTEKQLEKVGHLVHRGGGTERVVDELATLFPQARLARMDRDTVTQKDSYRRILGDMRSGAADILVGTQMIAKGHDLPGVTLVGIIDADVGLHFPDFRASERTFQLITQASGRAGRGSESGHVIVQTREPNHPTIVATKANRFKAFARYELEFRKTLKYPPYGRLLRVIIHSSDLQNTIDYAAEVSSLINDFAKEKLSSAEEGSNNYLSILGPAPASLEKINALYRWHILVKSNSAVLISQIARMLSSYHYKHKARLNLRLIVDVDPVDML